MQLENLHKRIHLNKIADGSVEVLFAGQPALTVRPTGDGGFYWDINHVFAKLTYGASVLSDVPMCSDNFDSVEMAVAHGMAKLESLGVFKTLVDLPDDTYAIKQDEYDSAYHETQQDLQRHALGAAGSLTESIGYLYKLQKKKIVPEFTSDYLLEKFSRQEEFTDSEKVAVSEHVYMKTGCIDLVTGMPINSNIVIEAALDMEAAAHRLEASRIHDAANAMEGKGLHDVAKRYRELAKTHELAAAKKDSMCAAETPQKAQESVEIKEPTQSMFAKFKAAKTAVDEGLDRSEFTANAQMSASKTSNAAKKTYRIVSPSGGTVSKHDSRNDAEKAHAEKNYGKKYVIESSINDVDWIPLTEDSDDADYQKWHDDVMAKHGAKGIKIKGRVEQGKQTDSAEVPGEDRSYGVWDHTTNTGHVFEESESVAGEIQERELSDSEKEKKEQIVTALKSRKGFTSKYGKDAIYAVATMMAKTAGG